MIPSDPRVPKPPGTITPSKFESFSILPLKVSESIQSIFTCLPIDAPACFKAWFTLTMSQVAKCKMIYLLIQDVHSSIKFYNVETFLNCSLSS